MNKSETRVAIIGGGRACHDLLTRIQANPNRLGLRVVGVADPDPNSPGMVLAREIGIELTVADYREFFACDGVDLVVELTGLSDVRDEVFRSLPSHVHFIDHYASRFFWDFFTLAEESDRQHRETEQRVLDERNRLRNILDSLPYEILVIDKNYTVELANRTFLEANKLTRDKIIGKYCYELEHKTKGPCDISLEGCPHAESLQAGRAVATVVSHEDELGLEHFAAVRAAPIRDDEGNILGVVEAIRDITQRVQTEEELKETRSRLDQFIDTAPLFIYMKNAKLHYRVINRHALEALGLHESDVVGKSDFDLFPDYVARRIREKELEVIRTGQILHAEGILPLRDRRMNFSATLFPVQKGDEVVGLFGLVEDSTELHESEEKLHKEQAQHFEAREYLAGILENSRDMIFLTDPTGHLLSFNAAAERVLGYAAESVLGRPLVEFGDDPQQFRDLFQETLREGHAVAYEMPLLRNDGEKAICNVSLTLINAPDDSPLEIVGICRDLTTRLRLQQDLIQSDRLAAVGKMAAGVAHEINNPLAIVDTIAGLITEIIDEEKANLHPANKEILEKAVVRLSHQVKRCSTITHSLLGFMKKSRPGKTKVKVAEILDESLDLLAPEIQESGAEIRRRYGPDLPQPVIDSLLLEQVFVNLLKNAFEAVEEKGEAHGVVEISTASRDDWFEVTIEDNGVGIPPESLGKIFDLFHTSKPAGKGTGLGLAIVHDIVKGFGGRIQVASEQDQWSRFTLMLPLQGDD